MAGNRGRARPGSEGAGSARAGSSGAGSAGRGSSGAGSARPAAGGLALVAATAVVLALAVLAAGAAGPAPRDPSARVDVDTAPLPPPTPSPTPSSSGPPAQQELADPLTVEISSGQLVLVAAILVLALAVTLLRRHVHAPAPAGPVPVPHPAGSAGVPDAVPPLLESAAEDAALQLSRPEAGSAQDAVIACWLRLEEGAAAAGTSRRPAQTPTEFTAAVLAGAVGPGDGEVAVRELLHLYHRARFGSRPLEDGAAERAAAALERIRAGLAARRRAGTSGQAPSSGQGART